MFCKNCGNEVEDNAYVCPKCGAKMKQDEEPSVSKDSGSKIGWGILSWFIPLVGLILFCVWKNDRPQTAKVCGLCALISFVLNIVLSIIMSVVTAGMLA